MSEIDSFFLQTNLNELNSPHKLSRYILTLPHYKTSIIGNNNNNESNSMTSSDNVSKHSLKRQLMKLSKLQLIKQCKQHNVPYIGTKSEMAIRILNKIEKEKSKKVIKSKKDKKKIKKSKNKKNKKKRSSNINVTDNKIHSNTDNDSQSINFVESASLQDLIVTNKLSEFVYQQRLNGQFFLSNFMQKDFENMISTITDQIKSDDSKSDQDENNYAWIWQVLQNINNSKTKPVIESKMDTDTLNWITSSFDRYETLFNYNKYINIKQKVTMHCICVSVHKCKALKRLIMALHFYQSLIDQIEKDNYLLVQYFRNNDNIYTDYKHILDKYIMESSQIDVNKKNLQIIKDKIKTYIKLCDMNNCISYKRKDNKFLTECIQKMQNGNINENNMVDFCSEIMDVIHCYFVHNISFK